MREIKFRVYDHTSKKMLQVQSMTLGSDPAIISYSTIEEPDVLFFPLIEKGINTKHNFSKPLQFTGLKDKNGKEIFEGDILNASWDVKLSVYFCELRCQFRGNLKNTSDRELDYFGIKKLEVIGNIYQNPELLK